MTAQEAKTLFRGRLGRLYPAGELDAMLRVIMDEVLHYSPVDVALRAAEPLPDFFGPRLEGIIARLERSEPLQYILGVARFHGHTLHVSPAVLIPRPETEQLVDMVLDHWGRRDDVRVADLCTGSGCIAVTLAREMKFAHVTGVDISHEALEMARTNAAALHVSVRWVEADVLEMPPLGRGSLDVLVSNPPYVAMSERAGMERNVLDYEPAEALFVPDDDPLVFYRPLTAIAAHALAPGGRLYLEVSEHRAHDVARLATDASLADAQVLRDSFGRERFVLATKP